MDVHFARAPRLLRPRLPASTVHGRASGGQRRRRLDARTSFLHERIDDSGVFVKLGQSELEACECVDDAQVGQRPLEQLTGRQDDARCAVVAVYAGRRRLWRWRWWQCGRRRAAKRHLTHAASERYQRGFYTFTEMFLHFIENNNKK